MQKKKIRVLVVDDSAAFRCVLTDVLNSDPDIEVVGEAQDGSEAIARCESLLPDVITMDVVMPKLDGIDASSAILKERNVAIILLTSLARSDEQRMALNALRLGVLDVTNKPKFASGTTNLGCSSIIRLVKAAAKAQTLPLGVRSAQNRATWVGRSIDIIAFGASTGGPQALEQLIVPMPADHPPIVIAQHLAETFTDTFAGWLASVVQRPVIAADSAPLEPGKIYMAPDPMDIVVAHGRMSCAMPEQGSRGPSVDRLFASTAATYGRNAIGIILTGMGRDGAVGLGEMRRAGAWTIAQDADSCAVYGMPRAAVDQDACCEVLPLPRIAVRLLEILAHRRVASSL